MPKIYSASKPKIAVIGGSGLEDPKFFKKSREFKIKTPFGYPSSPITIADFNGKRVAFLSRHGKKHQFPPHRVNSKANIWALKKLGIEKIIGVSAVGSLKKACRPGDIVIPDQFIDFTKKRDYTFYDEGAIHVSLADPFCPDLRKIFCKEADNLKIPFHRRGTYFCIEGPRFSTRAESKFFRHFADIIGMTLNPEVVLARELGMCYLSLSAITDWDVWKIGREVSADIVIKTMKLNIDKIKEILIASIPKIHSQRTCICSKSLKQAKL